MKTTFYLVRHGQPDWDWAEAMRFYGPCSAYMPLTPLGVEQIEHTACDSQLRGASFILASPYTRTMQSAQILSRRLDLPVLLGNDADCAAVGEYFQGAGRGLRDFVVLTLGTGLGAGIILDGRLRGGESSSEAGHMVLHAGGEPCPCGRRGCWEQYASATALIRDTKRTMAAHPESLLHAIAAEQGGVDGRTAFLAKERGDEAGAQVVEDYIEHLACGLTNLVNIFFPEVLALSGGVANQGDALLLPLRERVRERSFGSRYAVSHTRIELCTLGYRAGVIGAAMLARE